MAKKDAVKEKSKDNKVKRHFFKDFKAELKKVIWPTPKQLANNTVAVVTIVLITAVIVFILDVVFDSMNKYGLTKLQSYVVERFKDEDNSEESDTNNNINDTNTSTNTEQNTEAEGNTNTESNQE